MKKSRRSLGKSKSKAVTGGLLASAAAMLLPKPAQANTINEPGDFANTFATRQDLAAGTTGINLGTVGTGSDVADYFVFTGLNPGDIFTLSSKFTEWSSASALNFEWRTEPGGVPVQSLSIAPNTFDASFNGIVPLNGRIAVDLSFSNTGYVTYFDLNLATQAAPPTNAVPETGGTMMLMGATVAGLALTKKLRRKKKA